MHIDLTDEETAALTEELHEIVENDHYPLSPRIRTLRATSPSSDRSRSANPCHRRRCMHHREQPQSEDDEPAGSVYCNGMESAN
jgi:hypothetical protein